MERIDPEKIEEWLFMLNAPLPGREKVVRDDDLEADARAFMDLMNSKE